MAAQADPPGAGGGPGPSGPRLTVRASNGTVAGGALLVLAGGIVAASAWNGGVREALVSLVPAFTAVALAWFVFLGPRLEIGPAGIDLVGALRRTHVPWSAVDDAEADWGLRIGLADGGAVRWSALGRVDRRDGGYSEGLSQYFMSAFHRYRAEERRVRASGARRGAPHPAGDDVALSRWTDPASAAHETTRLSAAQTATVIVEYAQAVTAPGRGGRVRRSVRVLPALAILLPAAATAALYT